jgi:hypothetical protein
MKARTARFCLLPLLAAIGFPLGANADEVFEAKVSFTAVAQGPGGIEKIKIDSDALLNVALGRSPDAQVAVDELLAFVVDCESGEARLSAVDTSPLTEVVIADSSEVDVVEDEKGGQLVLAMEVDPTGGLFNSLDDGYFVLAGKFKHGEDGCPVSLSTSASGVIDATITDDVGTESFAVLITKGKLSTGKESIATLP